MNREKDDHKVLLKINELLWERESINFFHLRTLEIT
jgi:hypothetical protein